MKANCELNHNFSLSFSIWYDWLVRCLLHSVLLTLCLLARCRLLLFNYYDWYVLWLSLSFRCGDDDDGGGICISVCVIIVLDTKWVPLQRFVRIIIEFDVPKGCLQISFSIEMPCRVRLLHRNNWDFCKCVNLDDFVADLFHRWCI